MNAALLRDLLARLDNALDKPSKICIYGSGALMLLGEEDRFSVDIDVAGPYSDADQAAFAEAAARVGMPVNPPEDSPADHFEWVGPERLCLAAPGDADEVKLWQGRKLTVVTVSPADLAASKLIRYDPSDQSDIQFLAAQARLRFQDIEVAVRRLPVPFRDDALVRDNLTNLRADLARWTP